MGGSWAFFDLDGTLTDPGLGITNSIRYAMDRAGMAPWPREALYRFIGPPLLTEFQAVFGVDAAAADGLLRDFRVYFEDRGIFENQMYDGIPVLLARLRDAGLRLGVATSKPEEFAVQILEHFGIAPYFDAVSGSGMDERTRATKAEVLARALSLAGEPARESAVLVGDRRHDVLGAKALGLGALGVLYGYGSREELLDAGADALAESVEDVGDQLLFGPLAARIL